jgi:hypothetical protein
MGNALPDLFSLMGFAQFPGLLAPEFRLQYYSVDQVFGRPTIVGDPNTGCEY